MADPSRPRRAWVTLLTRESYVAGAVLLANSLHKRRSIYPLIILYTSTLPSTIIHLLAKEAALTNTILQHVDMLQPVDQQTLIAERFRDTWTKLRVFGLTHWDRLCFLDADMLVFKNIDELFETQFPDHGKGGSSWLAANHACVCNLDGDSWAPNDWNKDNCAFTGMTHPEALTEPPPVTQQGTHSLLNSGLFLFEPSKELWRGILEFLNSSPLLKDFLFPDQDFLAEYFRGRWISVGWQYNALKTWRYWHPNIWKDEEVRNLHYIVDKPWNKRAGNDGYLGNDDQTHRWWWVEYENWELNRQAEGEKEILAMVRAHIARPIEES